MMSRPNPIPGLLVIALLALALAMVFAPPAHAAWGTGPVEVHSSPYECGEVAAASDGAHGAIVMWHEAPATVPSVLRAQHLLASGDIDSSWSGPVSVSDTTVARQVLVALGDGAGGAYACWLEGTAIYLTHLGSNGAVSPGWPSRGRYLGAEWAAVQRPSVLVDGAGGIYVAWHQPSDPTPTHVDLMLAHIGPDNAAAGGFPASGVRAIGTTMAQVEWVVTSAIDLAPDHGLWVAWGTSVRVGVDPYPGTFRLLRLTPAGEPTTGWDAYGVTMGVFDSDRLELDTYYTGNWKLFTGMSLVGVASDGAGGAFVNRGDVVSDYPPQVAPRLLHYDPSGAPAPGWPASGILVCRDALGSVVVIPQDMGFGGSLRAMPDGTGGVYVSYAGFWYTDSPAMVSFDRYGATGARAVASYGNYAYTLAQVTQSGDGGLLMASCKAWGPYSQWEPYAFITGGLSNGGSYSEWHDTLRHWYGDVGAAATGDGGAIFCWSELIARQGVYAVRLAGSGLAGAPAPLPVLAPRLALRFAPGEGVRVRAGFAAAGEARLVLADVAGRAMARASFMAGAAEREWTLPGTALLPAGLYFARIEQAGRSLTAKVIVAR